MNPFGDDELGRRSGVSFGDTVRVRDTPVTRAAGFAGQTGTIYGHATPSLGLGIGVVGDPVDDIAVNVNFGGDANDSVWLTPNLVVLVDRNVGADLQIGSRRFIKAADGTWEPDDQSES